MDVDSYIAVQYYYPSIDQLLPNESNVPICDYNNLNEIQYFGGQNFSLSRSLLGVRLQLVNLSSVVDGKPESFFECSYNDSLITFIPSIQKIIIQICLMIFAVAANLVVLYTLLRARNRNQRISIFMAHLAFADLLVILVNIPLSVIWDLTTQWYAGDTACRLIKFFDTFGLYLSSFLLVCIALDRVFVIKQSGIFMRSLQGGNNAALSVSGCARLWSVGRNRIMLMSAWVLSAICASPQIFSWRLMTNPQFPWFNQCMSIFIMKYSIFWSRIELLYSFFNFCAVYIIPLFCLILCYVYILYILRKKSNDQPRDHLRNSLEASHRFTRPGVRNANADYGRQMSNARALTLKMTITYVVAFIVCWTPYYVLAIWSWVDWLGAQKIYPIKDVLLTFLIANSCINPIIYGMFSRPLSRKISFFFHWIRTQFF